MDTFSDAPALRSRPVFVPAPAAANEMAWPVVARTALQYAALSTIVVLVIWSAILAKSARNAHPLASIQMVPIDPTADKNPVAVIPVAAPVAAPQPSVTPPAAAPPAPVTKPVPAPAIDPLAFDPSVRWFNGRPVRPAREIWMTVTAYSPDARSCPGSDDGLTATLHSVQTNGFRLVAADPELLPYGTMLSIDGYDKEQIVPVLDCGSAIKGHRLDVLFPTHEQARAWGVRKIKVTVWSYIDGRAAENVRKVR